MLVTDQHSSSCAKSVQQSEGFILLTRQNISLLNIDCQPTSTAGSLATKKVYKCAKLLNLSV